MADIDHIKDVDNNIEYTLVDSTARNDITTINSKLLNEVYPICFNNGGGWVAQGREYSIILGNWSNARFNPSYDNAVMNLRVRFSDFTTPAQLDDEVIFDFDTEHEGQTRHFPVYIDKEQTQKATIGHIRGRTVDFIYVPLERCYYVVGAVDYAKEVLFENIGTGLQSDNVQDALEELYLRPSGATAATTIYNNTSSGLQASNVQDAIDEVVDELNDKADTSSLATVATSGDYDDLSNKPDLSVLQYLANIAAADDFVPGTSYRYLDFVKYNDHLYVCISSSGSTAGTFDPTEWKEIIIGEQVAEIARVNLLANRNKNRLDNLAPVATSGAYSDLSGTPPIPAAQVNSDWNAAAGVAEILNKPNLSAVATSGNYSDLNGAPTLAPVATSGLYADLVGAPTLAPVATSGDYDDLTDKPTFKTINGNAITGTGNITTPDTKPGNVVSNNGTNTLSVANNQWVDVATLALTEGKLTLISCTCVYPANSTGLRGVGIRDNNNTPVGYIFSTNVGAGTGGEIIVTWTGFIVPQSGQTYVMITRQSSGATISNVKWRYRHVALN